MRKKPPAQVYGPPNTSEVTSYNMGGPEAVEAYLISTYNTVNPDKNMDRQKQIRVYQLGTNREKRRAKG